MATDAAQEAHSGAGGVMAPRRSLTTRMEALRDKSVDIFQGYLAMCREIDEDREREDARLLEAAVLDFAASAPPAAIRNLMANQPPASQGPANPQPGNAPPPEAPDAAQPPPASRGTANPQPGNAPPPEAPDAAQPPPNQSGSTEDAERPTSTTGHPRTTGTSASRPKRKQARWFHAKPRKSIAISAVHHDEYILSYSNKNFMVIRCPGREQASSCEHYFSENPFEKCCAQSHFREEPHNRKLNNFVIAGEYGLKVKNADPASVRSHNSRIRDFVLPAPQSGPGPAMQVAPEADMGPVGAAERVQSDIPTTSSGAFISNEWVDVLVGNIKRAPDSAKPHDLNASRPQPAEKWSDRLDVAQDVVYLSSDSDASSWTDSWMDDGDDGLPDVYRGPNSDSG